MSRTCRAAIFIDEEDAPTTEDNAPFRERLARAFASVMGNCLDGRKRKKNKRKKSHLSDFLDKKKP